MELKNYYNTGPHYTWKKKISHDCYDSFLALNHFSFCNLAVLIQVQYTGVLYVSME